MNKPVRKPIKTFSKATVGLALLGIALLISTNPFGVEGKKAVQKETQQQVEGIQVSAITVATVDFQELARQQALNPQVSEPAPRAITAPMSIKEVDSEAGDASLSASMSGAVDIPSPNIPSPGPANNFAALDDIPFAPPGQAFFTIPPDTMGAVGTNSINKVMVTLNNNYRIQNKTTGAQIGGDVSMTNFWAPTGATNPFDPRVQYDPYNDRWIVAAVSDSVSANTSILVGVSQTNDPSGAYFLFRVSARIASDAANINFADFPMLGFNRNWVAVSINMFNSAGTFQNGRSLVIDYPTFRTGAFVGTYFTGVTAANAGFCMHPATTYSPTENTLYMPAHQASAGATYRLHTITGTPAVPVLTIGALLVRPGGGWVQPGGNIVPQAQGTCATAPTRLDSGDAFIRSNVVFRNNSIWYPQTIGLPAGAFTHTAAQWTQLNTAGGVIQGGRVDDPTATQTNGGLWYTYPSIAVNAKNDVVFGFTQASSNQFASAGYTFRDGTDAAGTMRDPVIYKTGEDCYVKDFGSGRNRWGDYSHTMVDPSDDCSFWTIQEYAKLQAPPTVGGSTSKWGTWWARVNALTPCAAGSANGAVIVQESCPPVNGSIDPGETVTVNLGVMNTGTGPTTNLVGTLLPSANVLSPSGPHTYGVVGPGGTSGRDFSFTANGAPGQVINLVLQLQDGANNLGTVAYPFVLGSNTACAGEARIGISSTLSCSGGGNPVATVTVSNTGTATANSVMLTVAKLGAVNGVPLPQNLGNIAPGGSVVTNVTFNGATGGVQNLQIGGTHSTGNFNSIRKVNAPFCIIP